MVGSVGTGQPTTQSSNTRRTSRPRGANKPSQTKGVREKRLAGLNPAHKPQAPQVGIASEQPLRAEEYESNMSRDEHETRVRAVHNLDDLYADTFPPLSPAQSWQSGPAPFQYTAPNSAAYGALHSSRTSTQTAGAVLQPYPSTQAPDSSFSNMYDPRLGSILQQQQYRNTASHRQHLSLDNIPPSGSQQGSVGVSTRTAPAPAPDPRLFAHHLSGLSFTASGMAPGGVARSRSFDSGLNNGPDRTRRSPTSIYGPYPVPPIGLSRRPSGNFERIPGVDTAAPRVITTIHSNDVLSEHRRRSASTNPPRAGRSESPTTPQASNINDAASWQRRTHQDTIMEDAKERARRLKNYRKELMKIIKLRIQSYIAAEVAFPERAELLKRIDQELIYALSLKTEIRNSGYIQSNDVALSSKAQQVVPLFRARFKDCAAILMAILFPEFGPPGIDVLSDNQPFELSDPILDVEEICLHRRSWVASVLSDRPRSQIIHSYDVHGHMVGLFEAKNLVPFILDRVLFQKPSGLGHIAQDLFSDGIPDTLFSLAGTAVLCSADEFTTGSFVARNFSREVYQAQVIQLLDIIQDVKRNKPALAARYRNLSKNIVSRGRLWSVGGSGEVSDVE